MLKRGRGRPRKIASDHTDNLFQEIVNSSDGKVPYSDDQLPEFFKVYIPAVCSETMRIPPKFMGKFGGDIPTICTLKTPSGVSWQVDMIKVDDHWFFQKGWPEFVRDNSLEDGEFLTFAYAGNSTFFVEVFSRNCCTKRAENIDDEPTEIMQEDEASQPENPMNNNRSPSFSLVIKKSYVLKGCQPIPKEFWRLYMRNEDRKGSSKVTLWIKNNSWTVDLKTEGGRIIFTNGCTKFVKENSLKIGTLCTFQLIDTGDLSFKVTIHRRKEMAKRGIGRSKKSLSGESAKFFKVFLPQLGSQQLLIPPDFAIGFKRTIKEKVILKDVGGKTWNVDVKETRDGRVFLHNGWQSFVGYQGVQVGDFLVFRYDRCFTFIVKIYGRSACKKEAALDNVKNVKIEKEAEEEKEENGTSHKRAAPPQDEDRGLSRGNERSEQCSERFREENELQQEDVASEKRVQSEDAEGCLSGCPYFVSTPSRRPSKKFKLRIPDEVMNKHNLKLEPEMKLRNEEGKEWAVKIFRFHEDGATFFGRGWNAFQVDNNVGLNDRCKFTFERFSTTVNVQNLSRRK